jgi:hypothetical protein
MAKNPVIRLGNANISSLDLDVGDQVESYLCGDINKREMVSGLKSRRKEMLAALKGVDKLLEISKECPQYNKPNEEE